MQKIDKIVRKLIRVRDIFTEYAREINGDRLNWKHFVYGDSMNGGLA